MIELKQYAMFGALTGIAGPPAPGAGQWIRSRGLMTAQEYRAVSEEFPADEARNLLMESDSPAGRLTHLKPAVQMSETPPRWDRPSVPLGFDPRQWPARAS